MSAVQGSPAVSRSRAGVGLRLRSRITAGLVFAVPIWVTLLVVMLVFRLMRDSSLWLVKGVLLSPLGEPFLVAWGLESEQLASRGLEALPILLQWSIDLFSVALTVLLLYALGAVATNVMGKRLIRTAEVLFDRVPFVKIVYHASKKVVETIANGSARPFKKVVLVPFPTAEIRSIGFITAIGRDQRTGEPVYTVFMATAPNPTTGFVLVLTPSDVIELDWSVEQAVKAIMSGGVLMPGTVPLGRGPAVATPEITP